MYKYALIFLILFVSSIYCSIGFDILEEFEFDSDILNVERRYYNDQWIHIVQTDSLLYILVDGIIDTNYISFDEHNAVVTCPDSIVLVTSFEDSSEIYCRFEKIYPSDYEISTLPGMDFDFCIWSDSLGKIVYLINGSESGIELGNGDVACYDIEDLTMINYLYNFMVDYIEYTEEKQYMHSYRHYTISCFEHSPPEPYTDYDVDYYEYSRCDLNRILRGGGGFSGYAKNGVSSYTVYFHYYCEGRVNGINSMYYVSNIGKSLVDVDDDGSIDIPYYTRATNQIQRWNCDYGEYDYIGTTTTVSERMNFSEPYNLPLCTHPGLFAGNFIDSVNVNYIDNPNVMYYGDSLSESFRLTNIYEWLFLERYNLTDFNNDGVHEFYDYFAEILMFIGIKMKMEFQPGWNLVASPYTYESSVPLDDIFSFSPFDIYWYNSDSSAYIIEDSLESGKSYFVFSEIDTSVYIHGATKGHTYLHLSRGWNMLSSENFIIDCNEIIRSFPQVLSFFTFNPETNEYEEPENIVPGQGFWVLATSPVTIRLD